MTTTTSPLPPEGWTKVRSCLVTREMLRDWGFEVSGCSTSHDTRKGPDFTTVRHTAWKLGWTVLSSHRDEERVWMTR